MTLLRLTIISGAASLIAGFALAEPAPPPVSVAKSPTCGCCNAWIAHLEQDGFHVDASNLTAPALDLYKRQNGIEPETMSCHTAKVAGYTIEGHVPASDIRKLLEERPDAVGLSVPGMPIGSPGMEMGGGRDAYDVLLIRKDGETEIFSSYEAR